MENDDREQTRYLLRLYSAGRGFENTPFTERLKHEVSGASGMRCDIEVIDVLEDPEQAVARRIFATPMLVKDLPGPVQRVVGDLGDIQRVLMLLGLEKKAVTDSGEESERT